MLFIYFCVHIRIGVHTSLVHHQCMNVLTFLWLCVDLYLISFLIANMVFTFLFVYSTESFN